MSDHISDGSAKSTYLGISLFGHELVVNKKGGLALKHLEFPWLSRHRIALAKAMFLGIALISGVGLLGKISLLQRFAPLSHWVLIGIVWCSILCPLIWKLALRWRRSLATLVLLGIVIVSLVIYPRVQSLQQIGRGSDQATCVIVASQGLVEGQWPYNAAHMWSHNPMSCGPGWVALQTPATILAGYRWNLIALWAIASLLLLETSSWTAVTGVLCLLGLEAAVWVAASDGTDFITFGILIAALFAASQKPNRFDLPVLILMALVVQFRFPMIILPVLLFPAARLTRAVVASSVAFVCNLGFLLWKPSSFVGEGPLHLFYKVTHTHLLTVGRAISAAELVIVFGVMLAVAIFARLLWPGAWLGLGYLVLLLGLPATLDLIGKARIAPISIVLGSWEGANWLTGCLPMAALLLLEVTQNLGLSARKNITEPAV